MKPAIIVTSINAPNLVMESLAKGAVQANQNFIVVGDTKSPEDFQLNGCLETQFQFAKHCPTRHYACLLSS